MIVMSKGVALAYLNPDLSDARFAAEIEDLSDDFDPRRRQDREKQKASNKTFQGVKKGNRHDR